MSSARVFRRDPDLEFENHEALMEFRLTYDGPLRASNSGKDHKPARKEHRQHIRRHLHLQLKRLWAETPQLVRGESGGPLLLNVGRDDDKPATTVNDLAAKLAMYGFNFVPLVTAELRLLCQLDILMLRREEPGRLIQASGDIDNRIKTLLDTLQIPDANQEYSKLTPAADEVPFFVLLEDDRLVTKVAVDTDKLFSDVPNPDGDHENDVRVVITVRIRPRDLNLWNIQYG